MALVYAVYTYEDHGAEDMKCTIDPTSVERIVRSWGEDSEVESNIPQLLEKIATGQTFCMRMANCWGALTVDAIELE